VNEDLPTRPLFVVTEASGVGKTAVCEALTGRLERCAVYDLDLIWAPTWDERDDNWFRIAHANGLAGLDTVFCGTMLPSRADRLPNRCLVGEVRYACLHCSDTEREHRLHQPWQYCLPDGAAFIERQREFAAWLVENAANFWPPNARPVDEQLHGRRCRLRSGSLDQVLAQGDRRTAFAKHRDRGRAVAIHPSSGGSPRQPAGMSGSRM
jgi:hypothetical protein